MAARDPERAKEIEKDWRAWWEANKDKYPPGMKLPVPEKQK